MLQNPAFGPSQIRELTDVFVEKAIEVCFHTFIAQRKPSLTKSL